MTTKKVAKIARGVVIKQAERKYFITESVNAYTGINFSGSITNFGLVPQGDTDQTRDGDALTLLSLQLKVSWTVGDAFNLVRTVVFQWMDNSVPGITSVLNSTGEIGTPLVSYVHDSRKSFRILLDRTYELDTAGKSTKVLSKVFTKFPCKQLMFSGASTTAVYGGLYMILISDSGVVTHPSIVYHAKLNFTDG